ncbi:MAG: hypothetical protein PHW73_02295 [Atribacterota bacterium]|nr:hypothetical protein [Atribacterota bacterium]
MKLYFTTILSDKRIKLPKRLVNNKKTLVVPVNIEKKDSDDYFQKSLLTESLGGKVFRTLFDDWAKDWRELVVKRLNHDQKK